MREIHSWIVKFPFCFNELWTTPPLIIIALSKLEAATTVEICHHSFTYKLTYPFLCLYFDIWNVALGWVRNKVWISKLCLKESMSDFIRSCVWRFLKTNSWSTTVLRCGFKWNVRDKLFWHRTIGYFQPHVSKIRGMQR